MNGFVFRLETLLRLHKQTRDLRRGELAEAYRVDEALQQQLAQIDAQVEAIRDFCRQAASPGAVNVDRLVEAQRFEIALSGQQRSVKKQREGVAQQLELRRQALVEADRDVRMMEKLREHKADEHRRQEDAREVKRLDEVAASLALRARVLAKHRASANLQQTDVMLHLQ